jgi:hypothetical protein
MPACPCVRTAILKKSLSFNEKTRDIFEKLIVANISVSYISLLLTAIGLVPGGSFYKKRTYIQQKTAHTSHEKQDVHHKITQ